MRSNRFFISLLVVVMFFLTLPSFAQITFHHDASVQNQFTVGEIGFGNLTPDIYYDMFHTDYRAYYPTIIKNNMRMDMNNVLFKEIGHSENLDSALKDRMKVEAFNMLDRNAASSNATTWQFERGRIEDNLSLLKQHIERIIPLGGTVESYRMWVDQYNSLQMGKEAICRAYMPQGKRKKEFQSIFADILKKNTEVCELLQYLRNKDTVKNMTEDATIAVPDTSVFRRIANASRSRWNAVIEAVHRPTHSNQ